MMFTPVVIYPTGLVTGLAGYGEATVCFVPLPLTHLYVSYAPGVSFPLLLNGGAV